MAAELMPQFTNTQGEFVSTRCASRGSVITKKRAGINRERHASVAWKRLIDLTQVDVIRTV
jgi:hypothetical protein